MAQYLIVEALVKTRVDPERDPQAAFVSFASQSFLKL